MMYFRFIVCGSLISMLAACAQRAPCPEARPTKIAPSNDAPIAIAVPSEGPSELAVAQRVNEKLAPAGASVYLRVELDAKAYGAERIAGLTEGLKASLAKKKFDVRASSPGAHSQLTVTSFEDPATDARGIALVWGVRRAGQRPQRWVQQSFTVRAPIATVFPKLSAKLLENFEALEITAPTGASPVAGNLSCAPRFGFEIDEGHHVVIVSPKSPALRAGVRVGDIILAIDSRAPSWDRPIVTEDVYSKRIWVPLKVERQGVVVRSQLRAEILCD